MTKVTIHKLHKWVGVVFSIFIILFCLSGIVLNHRQAFSSCVVSRDWLPEAYQIKDWNQNIIKGTIRVSGGFKGFQRVSEGVIAYGQAGVWLTDRQFKTWTPFNDGIDEGIDNRKINGVVQTQDVHSTDSGTVLWCAALWDVYRYVFNENENQNENFKKGRWQKVALPDNDERISDITLKGKDTIMVATRSFLYEAVAPNYQFKRIELKPPVGYEPETSLFKTVWMLHSGQLFGLTGKLVVDFLAVVLIILCLTGIVFFLLGYTHRLNIRILTAHTHNSIMAWNLKWHNRFGAHLIVLTVLLSVTGMCLRPPLMMPLVLTKTAPVPGSTLDTDNFFHDKIRAIRWDDRLGLWLMSTSEGFFQMENGKWRMENSAGAEAEGSKTVVPVKIESAPTVSPMGITVFERNPADSTEWLIGSFAGLERWNPETGRVTEWFKDAPEPSPIPSTNGHLVTGFSKDITGAPVVFEYSSAPCAPTGFVQDGLSQMPETLKKQPMSLWNFALELHTGRMYECFLGSILSILFVFVSGLLLTLTLISGYIIYRRSHRTPKH